MKHTLGEKMPNFKATYRYVDSFSEIKAFGNTEEEAANNLRDKMIGLVNELTVAYYSEHTSIK